MVKRTKQLTKEELCDLIKVATSRISGEMNSNSSLQMNCVGGPVIVPNCLLDKYYGTTFKFFGLGPMGLPTHVLFTLDRVAKIKPNKTILCGNVTVRTSQVNGEKIIIDFTKNRVKYRNRQEKCIYDLEIDNRFKPLWDRFLFELKRVLHLN